MTSIYESIEEIASAFRKKAEELIGFDNNVSDFLKKLVEALHGTITIVQNPEVYEMQGGSLTIQPDGTFNINLPPQTSPLRDNFTIAHELGHYLLHYEKKEEPQIFTRYGTNDQEFQANRFAAAFLMPKDRFKEALVQLNNSSLLIAAKFQVSEQAVIARMGYIK